MILKDGENVSLEFSDMLLGRRGPHTIEVPGGLSRADKH